MIIANRTFVWYDILMESTHDRVVASRLLNPGLPEYIGREVALMTAYEIIEECFKECEKSER